MKQINLFKALMLLAFISITGIANGQIHPLAFGSYTLGTTATTSNWYANYVGLRVEVVNPGVIAGSKNYKAANSGTGATGDWGGAVTTPIINMPIFMDTTSDSFGCTSFSTAAMATMNGKIAVIWRGPLPSAGTPCDFGCKALNAQNAGAIACVLINEYPGQGPVGMAASTTCTGITIPVFMISNLDGIAISAQYRSGVPVNMTITQWGQNFANDLGFVPGGAAMWHNYAIPSNQLGNSGNPEQYNMIDGAFIANFGTVAQTGVSLKTTTSFTPTGGSTTSQHTSSVDLTPAFSVADSIMAMFKVGSEYSLSAPGTGRFDINYVIEHDLADDFPSDNHLNVSFYTTDSLYSKGTYNFSNNTPSRTIYEQFGGGTEYIWGPMYYVANGGTNLSSVQYSIAMNSTTSGYPFFPNGSNNIYVFKWNDGTVGGAAADSIVENGELELVGLGVKNYNSADTSEATLWCQISSDLSSGDPLAGQVPLLPNSWYYVAIDVVSSTAAPLFLGCDGVNSAYPRIFGRFHNGGHLLDYNNFVLVGDLGIISDSLQGNPPVPAGQTAFISSVDSFVYSSMLGVIPAVSMIANNTPNSVKPSPVKPLADVNLFPNPAKDQLNVSASFDKAEPTVSYEIIDGLARFVSKEIHTNVKDDIYTINTSKLAAGNYYLIINAEGKAMAKKFVVTK